MSRYRALIALPLAIALTTAACAKDPASGIIVALQTDMALPDDVTSVSLDVTDTATGSVLQSIYGVIEGDNIRFPSTITVARGDSYNLASVTIRVVAYKDDKAQVLRSITTTLPETDFALLPVDLSYLDWGSASGSLSEASPTSVDPVLTPAGKLGNPLAIKGALCPDGETSVYGECVPQVVDVKTLQKYSDGLVFGDNKCFDFQACFETRRVSLGDGVALTLNDKEEVSIRFPQGVDLDRVNFAVRRKRPPTSAGAQKSMCKGADCFVVLNRGSAPVNGQRDIPKGAYYIDPADPQVITLRPGFRDVLQQKRELLADVVVGYGCQPKTRETPLCSPDVTAQANAPDPNVVPPAALVGPAVEEPVGDAVTSLGDFVLAAGKPVFLSEPDGVNIGNGTPLLNISGSSARLFVDSVGTTFLYGGYDAGIKQGAFAVVGPDIGSATLFSATGKDSLAVLDAAILQGGANFLAYATGIPFGGTTSALVPSFYELTYDPAVKAIRAKEIAHSPGACSAIAADGKDIYVACGTTFQSKVGRFTPGSAEIVPFATVDGLVRSMVVDHPAGTLPTVYATVGGVTHSAIVRVDAATPATELGAVLNATPFTLDGLLQGAQRSLILDQDYLYFPIEGGSPDPLTRADRILAIPKAGGDWQEIGKAVGSRPLRTVRADDNAIYWNTVRDGQLVLKIAPKCWKQPKKCL